MGGINPNRPIKLPPPPHRTDADLPLTLRHCRRLFLSTSQFFAAHAALEDAVISEADGEPIDIATIEESRNLISQAAETLQGAVEDLESNRTILIEEASGSWHSDYFTRQSESIREMSRISGELVDAMAAPSVDEAAENGSLQASLWHEEANHRVRTLSIAYLEKLIAALQHHITVVAETNASE